MRYDSGQFQSFDGLDNRKAIMDLLRRLGDGKIGDARRGGFLQGLVHLSTNGFHLSRPVVQPCGVVDAYMLFVAVTGCLGVDVEMAAEILEDLVRGADERLRDLQKFGCRSFEAGCLAHPGRPSDSA